MADLSKDSTFSSEEESTLASNPAFKTESITGAGADPEQPVLKIDETTKIIVE